MTDITPTDEQAKAIKAIVDWYGEKGRNEFYLAGYAGVGKSTIAALAIEDIKERHNAKNVRTAAYTGKAASVLRKKGNEAAQTIHSLIYIPTVDKKTKELKFVLSKDSAAADADLIVLDECSMIDDRLADDLRSFGKKILVMGDPANFRRSTGKVHLRATRLTYSFTRSTGRRPTARSSNWRRWRARASGCRSVTRRMASKCGSSPKRRKS